MTNGSTFRITIHGIWPEHFALKPVDLDSFSDESGLITDVSHHGEGEFGWGSAPIWIPIGHLTNPTRSEIVRFADPDFPVTRSKSGPISPGVLTPNPLSGVEFH